MVTPRNTRMFIKWISMHLGCQGGPLSPQEWSAVRTAFKAGLHPMQMCQGAQGTWQDDRIPSQGKWG